jgi:hypothetical protein
VYLAFNEPAKLILSAQEKMEYDSYPKEEFTQKLFKTYFALPMQVNYVVEALPIPHFTHPDTPKLHLLCNCWLITFNLHSGANFFECAFKRN